MHTGLSLTFCPSVGEEMAMGPTCLMHEGDAVGSVVEVDPDGT